MADPGNEAERTYREMIRAAEELRKAAREMSDAAGVLMELEVTLRSAREGLYYSPLAAAFVDHPSRRGLPEEAAAQIADESVHRVRKELAEGRAGGALTPPPSPEEVEDWEKRREERRRREAS